MSDQHCDICGGILGHARICPRFVKPPPEPTIAELARCDCDDNAGALRTEIDRALLRLDNPDLDRFSTVRRARQILRDAIGAEYDDRTGRPGSPPTD